MGESPLFFWRINLSNEKNMLDALIQHQVYSYRASTKVVNELLSEYAKASNKLVIELKDKLDNLTVAEQSALLSGKYTTDTLKEIKQIFDDWYDVLAVQIPESFAVSATALAVYEAGYMAKLYGDSVDADKIAKKSIKYMETQPLIRGIRLDDIWTGLAENTRKNVLSTVLNGIQEGTTNAQIGKAIIGEKVKIKGVDTYVGGIINGVKKKSDIEADIRTVRSIVANQSYIETFNALGFEYLKIMATLDGRTCSTCASRDGDVHEVEDLKSPPPWHHRSRTVVVGCDKDGKIDGKRPFVADTRSVKNIPKDERSGKIGQIDANTSYPEWFGRQSATFQKEVLGKTKYELYKNGGFTFDKFVDPLGKPYTIAELRALDEKTFKELGL